MQDNARNNPIVVILVARRRKVNANSMATITLTIMATITLTMKIITTMIMITIPLPPPKAYVVKTHRRTTQPTPRSVLMLEVVVIPVKTSGWEELPSTVVSLLHPPRHRLRTKALVVKTLPRTTRPTPRNVLMSEVVVIPVKTSDMEEHRIIGVFLLHPPRHRRLKRLYHATPITTQPLPQNVLVGIPVKH